jgi:hypothetical protein
LETQLLSLSPRGRIAFGVIGFVVGAVTTVVLWGQGLVWGFSLFALVFGPALSATGVRDAARQRRFDGEVARAKAEWADLQRDLALARRTGQNVARLLQQRGYREFAVRQWLARELGGKD